MPAVSALAFALLRLMHRPLAAPRFPLPGALLRVLMVWIYDNAGRSVLAVALYHAVANLSMKSVFPGGSYEGERVMAIMLAGLAALVALVWGPRTLAGRAAPVTR